MSSTNSPQYLSGFGSHFSTEALPGALPVGCNSPQVCPYGLYAEQLNGTAFTAPRVENFRSWLYRIQPGAAHLPFEKVDDGLIDNDFSLPTTPTQLRWSPYPHASADKPTDFVAGLATAMGAGSPSLKTGIAIYLYAANTSMVNSAFYNSDGDMLVVPQEGDLEIRTELGVLVVKPTEIVVIPRGIVFAVKLLGERARGYVLETFGAHFRIPDLGPIGSNGLANPRDFQAPVASFEDRKETFRIYNKFLGHLYAANSDHSPFNVVAWHGNYYPYKYDLKLFNTVGTVSYDHMDPSIFTVLTSPSGTPGTAAADFVIFPPRWAVAENTFRPPWYHRNCMSETMGLIYGIYEAKKDGFLPGGMSLHSCMTPHGPDAQTFEAASKAELHPERVAEGSLAFMFESCYLFHVTKHFQSNYIDKDYYKCWQGLVSHFDPTKK